MKKTSKYLEERRKYHNRPRKILNLEERVKVIQMYERTPVYQRIASTFKCSWEQIKNVVLNRDAILQYYALCQTVTSDDNPRTVRQKKINFLGKVMYEFIKRAFYHMTCLLTDDIIKDKALVFRDILKIDSFYPNKAWITDFKHAYHLDLENLDNIVITDMPPKSMNPRDIIDYCNKELKEANDMPKSVPRKKNSTKSKQHVDPIGLDNENNMDVNDIDAQSEISDKDNEAGEIMDFGEMSDGEYVADGTYDNINENEDGPTINYGDYECDDDDGNNSNSRVKDVKETFENRHDEQSEVDNSKNVDLKNNLMRTEDDKNSKDSQHDSKGRRKATTYAHFFTEDSMDNDLFWNTTKTTRVTNDKNQSSSKMQQNLLIKDYTAALDLLRPLEEFAIMEEDFSAINLLSQLSEVYQRAVKRKRLE